MTLVDSDVLIAHLRGNAQAAAALRRLREAGPLNASVVTLTEIVGGMRSGERSAVWRLFSGLELVPVTEAVARRAGEFARRFRASHHSIGTVDYLIAATADVHGWALATLNVRHFPMFVDLRPAF